MNGRILDELLTYNPDFVEEHTDTSDFEKHKTQKKDSRTMTRRYKKVKKMEAVNQKILKRNQLYSDMEYKGDVDLEYARKKNTRHSKNNFDRTCGNIGPETKNNNLAENFITFSRGDQNYMKTSQCQRRLRNTIIPCLSNIFKRSNCNVKHNMATINKDCGLVRKDNACQVYCLHCNDMSSGKSNKNEQIFLDQSFYGMECYDEPVKEPVRYNQKQTNHGHLFKNDHRVDDTLKNSYDVSLDLINELEILFPDEEKPKRKFVNTKGMYQTKQEIVGKKQIEQSLSSNKEEYQILTNPTCQPNSLPDTLKCNNFTQSEGTTETSSSVFWEFIYDKINRRLQAHNPLHSLCTCSEQQDVLRSNYKENQIDKILNTCISCSCQTTSFSSEPMNASDGSNTVNEISKPLAKMIQKGKKTVSTSAKTRKPKCRCNMSPSNERAQDTQNLNQVCQKSHDKISAFVSENYNGEILCIHNPPCILINGCLNLPVLSNTPPVQAWPLVKEQKSTYLDLSSTDSPSTSFEEKPEYCTGFCNIQHSVGEGQIEKNIQSCLHDPLYQRVRKSHKRYDPKMADSCVHVPLCRKLPNCMLAKDLKSCCHKPKCVDVRECTKCYESVADVETHVKLKAKTMCKHEPPCIMIPKCLGRLMCGNCLPFEAMPSCTHRPTCERIPGCCRRPPKMVSVYSQYPAPCRIV